MDTLQEKTGARKQVIDLSLLPPCTTVLLLRAKRSNAVAYLWRNATNPIVEFPPLQANGWLITGEILWMDDPFPNVIEELLAADYNADIEYDYGSDVENDIEEQL